MLGYDFHAVQLSSVTRSISAWVSETRATSIGRHVHLVNAYTLALSEKDSVLANSLAPPAINLMDGTPLAWLARIRRVRGNTGSATPGPAVFRRVLDESQDLPLRHFFLGGSQDTLDDLVREIHEKWPRLKVVGALSPPFRSFTSEDHNRIVAHVNAVKPDVVWVGLGTPKQDIYAARLASELPVVTVAVGAAFDFLAGSKPEAPSWIRGSGFEWLFRLLTEPRRLAFRYIVGNASFIRLALKDLRR